ncbi:MAG: deoxyribonuclease IV [Syntrophomonadaceae bacterium]|nr:deoxyribonuclease IV [Syntrophomonadaceae bacterium]
MYIGAHLPISKGFRAAVQLAQEIGANTFQYFTRNPRGSQVKALDMADIQESQRLMQHYSFFTPVAHAPYTMNLASPSDDTRGFAVRILREDLERAEKAGTMLLAIHPGSHGGKGSFFGLERIIEGLNLVLHREGSTHLLLEGMAGQGSELGSTFEELKQIRQGVNNSHRIGFILDTCHLYAAGYDVLNDLEGVLKEFDQLIGLKHLKALHVNDSKYSLGSRRDRHSNLGEGYLGLDFFSRLVKNPVVRKLPLILETPGDLLNYQQEIRFLRQSAKF